VSGGGEVTVEKRADGSIALSGEITLLNAHRLLEASKNWFAGDQAVIVDLGGLRRSDSGGLALLLEWARRARSAGREIRYQHVPDQIRDLAKFCNLDGILSVA
jgi:phospholipid transport system transporter-binding protein